MQGSFVKKRGRTWTAYYYAPAGATGRRQLSKGGFATKAEAQQHLVQAMGKIQSGEYVQRSTLTVAEYLLDRWLPVVELSLRPTTFDSYERMLRLHVIPASGGVALQKLSADDLDRFYRELLTNGNRSRPGGLSPKTVRYIHNTLHKALKDAERKGLVSRNVASLADPPRMSQSGSTEMKTWTPEELRTFLSSLRGHRLEAAYLLAATTGMRRGEVLGVRWSDLNVAERRLALRQTVVSINYKVSFGTPKTARGRRSIALDPSTMAALHEHRGRQDEDKITLEGGYRDQDLIFAKIDGNPIHPDYFSQLFDRRVAKLAIPHIRLHDLRHTHATLGLSAGISPKVMSDRLGHATVAFTQDVYMHAIPRLEMEAAEQLATLIFESHTNPA